MSLDEIYKIRDEYNQIETDQVERLKRLFNLINERKGFRRVLFGSKAWINCWGLERLDLSHKIHVESMSRPITLIEPGED
jgi:hypothetical protein